MNEPLGRMARIDARLSGDGQSLILDASDVNGQTQSITLPRTVLGGLIASLMQIDRDVMNQLAVDEGGPEG
jgi:hypothetical protein